MGVAIKKINVQAQLWTIPGPLFICCILLMIVLKGSGTPLSFPITAVVGVLACYIWKWRGVAFSSALLGAVMVYALQSQPSDSWLWITALTLSIASTFVVTVLCSEEANHAWDALHKDSSDHKQTLSHLNERYLTAQNRLIAEQNELSFHLDQLREQLAFKEEKQRSNEQLIKLARHEITTTFAKQEKLLQELVQARYHSDSMEIKLIELQELVDPENAKKYGKVVVEELQNQLLNQIEASKLEAQHLQQQIAQVRIREAIAVQQAETLANEMAALSETAAESEFKIVEITKQHSNTLQEVHQRLEVVVREKQKMETTLLSLQEQLELASLQEQEWQKQVDSELLSKQMLQLSVEDHENRLLLQESNVAELQDKLLEKQNELEVSQSRLVEQQNHHEERASKLQKQQIFIEELQDQLVEQGYKFEEQEMKFEAQLELHENLVGNYQKHSDKVNDLETQLDYEQTENEKLITRCEMLKQEKAALELQQQELKEIEIAGLLFVDELKSKNEELLQLQKEHILLQQKHQDFIGLDQENQDLLQKLAQQTEILASLNTDKQCLLNQLEQLKQVPLDQAEISKNPAAIVDDREVRRIEGLYQQLRQQFKEKSEVLSATRRELFATQEMLLVLQMDREEEKIDDDKETNESLRRLIAAAESELALAEHQHVLEINRLHEVIESLMVRA